MREKAWVDLKKEAPKISIIIPVCNEAERLPILFERLESIKADEVVFVDGDSEDNTKDRLEGWLAEQSKHTKRKVVFSSRGRGKQMNAGEHAAEGDILLFLHADTGLPGGGIDLILESMKKEEIQGGAFYLQIDSPHFFLAWVSKMANFRSVVLKLPYGDQAFFVRQKVFQKMGGYRPMPLMEDVEFIQRLKKTGKIILLKTPVVTSARRWEKQGYYYTSLRNMMLLGLYFLKVSPARLARWYDA